MNEMTRLIEPQTHLKNNDGVIAPRNGSISWQSGWAAALGSLKCRRLNHNIPEKVNAAAALV